VVDGQGEIEEFLKREGVDVVVGCDLPRGDLVRSSFPSSSLLSHPSVSSSCLSPPPPTIIPALAGHFGSRFERGSCLSLFECHKVCKSPS